MGSWRVGWRGVVERVVSAFNVLRLVQACVDFKVHTPREGFVPVCSCGEVSPVKLRDPLRAGSGSHVSDPLTRASVMHLPDTLPTYCIETSFFIVSHAYEVDCIIFITILVTADSID